MHHKRMIISLASACIGMTSQVSLAGDLNYAYAEIGYSNIDSDFSETDGVTARFSFPALDFIHVKGEYSRLFVDDIDGVTDDDVDIDRFVIGVGGNYSVTRIFDILATVSYVDNQFTGDIKDKVEGYQVEAGARVQAMDKLELNAKAIHLEIEDYSETGYGVGAVIDFYKKFALSLDARHFDEDDETEFFVGIRVNM